MFEPIGSYHMFDGDGMLHGVTFDEGRVSLPQPLDPLSRGLGAEIGARRRRLPGLGDVMDFPDRSLTGDAGPVKNPANTHIIRHAGRYLALWEGGLPTEVTAELDTVGEHDFGGRLRGSMTAHPRLDPRTGEMCFFAYSLFAPYLRYYVVDADGALVHSVDLDLPAPVMMHDFVITEHHAVFLDSPIVFNMDDLGNGPDGELAARERHPHRRACPAGAAPRTSPGTRSSPATCSTSGTGGSRATASSSPAPAMAAPDFGIDPEAPLDRDAADPNAGHPARFWVDLAQGTAGWEPLDDLGGDFNRVNDDLTGVRTRYHYMSAFVSEGRPIGDFDTIVRYDDATGDRQEWWAGAHGHVGESVFAPDPAGSAEDDGWLVNAVYDDERDATDVVVLDARDVAHGPIATVHLPRRMPFGFHANWFPAEAGAVAS